MYQQYRPTGFSILPKGVKNIMIINGLMFLLKLAVEKLYQIDLNEILGLYLFESTLFRPWQVLTHVFMHGNLGHLASNMFMLWMFGNILENVWGAKRFLIYYFVTAFGAAFLLEAVNYYHFYQLKQTVSFDVIDQVLVEGPKIIAQGKNWSDATLGELNLLLNTPTVGASGAVFGVLLAFGMLFPNTEIFLYFLFPIKAKYFVAFLWPA